MTDESIKWMKLRIVTLLILFLVMFVTFKAPGRIEAIAMEKLQGAYPEREQVVIIP